MNDPSKAEGYSLADWQKHYDDEDLRWDLGEVAPPFVRLWNSEPPPVGRALVPGCGQGHEVLFLAKQGWQVTAVDFAPGAIGRLNERLKAETVSAELIERDFFALDSCHDQSYDLLLEHTFFCAIHPDRRADYVQTVARLLKPGGLLVGLFYETNEPDGPPFNTTPADLRENFSEQFEIAQLDKTPHSAEQRRDKEWLGLFKRK